MSKGQIRPLALGVFWKGDHILVEEAFDLVKNETFYRPLGGGIEFGEPSADALRREIREEINAEIDQLHLLGTLENIFTHNGEMGHEIVRIYEATFVDPAFYEQDQIAGMEDDHKPIRGRWLPLEKFASGYPPLYPDGLYEFLRTVINERTRQR